MSVRLPAPSARYDARDEAETRRTIEQALADLAASQPDVTGPSVGGSGTIGKIPIWTGATTLGDSDIDAANIAYLSDLFTQAMADARYSLLGHTHSASEITDFDAAITAFGDARYFKLTDTHLDGPLDIGDVTGIAAAMLRVGGDIRASGEMDADDFVLVGGAAGGGPASALFSVSDEGVLKASAVSSINFTGGGVVASAVGDAVTVAITFDQAAADARYALLGHTHSSAEITDFAGAVGTVGNALWLALTGGTLTGALHGTTADFSGEVDADDFVLVGGSSGGGASAALFSVLDEGVLKSSAVSSINFTGAGVTASAVGDAVTVAITFDQGAADARYSQLGHTHPTSQITDFYTAGDARWLNTAGDTMTGTLFLTDNGFRLGLSGFGVFNAGDDSFLGDGATGRGLSINRTTWTASTSDALVVGGGLRQVGSYMARIESSFINAPQGTTGPGIEMGIDGGAGLLQGYDRTAGAYIPLRFAGSSFKFYGPLRSENEITSGVPWWQLDTNGGSPGIARLVFGSDGSGYAFEIARNIGGSSTPLFRFFDNGEFRPLAGRGWTTSGWSRSIALASASAIGWNIGTSYARWALSASGDIFCLWSTSGDDSAPSPTYHLTVSPSVGFTFNSSAEFGGSLTIPNGVALYGRRATGNAQVALFRYDSGTDNLSTVLGGAQWFWRDTGAGVLGYVTTSGHVGALVAFDLNSTVFASTDSSYHKLYNRGGGIAMYLGGSDPTNYYDNGGHVFRNRASTVLLTIDGSGNTTAHDFILS